MADASPVRETEISNSQPKVNIADEINCLDNDTLQYLRAILDDLVGYVTYRSVSIFLIGDLLKPVMHRGEPVDDDLIELFNAPKFSIALAEHQEIRRLSTQQSGHPLPQPLDRYLNPGLSFDIKSEKYLSANWVCLPLQQNEYVLGFIVLNKNQNGGFLQKEINHIRTTSEFIALLIDKEMKLVEAQRSASEVKAIIAVQHALTSRLELEPVLQLIADGARRLTNTRSSYLMLTHGDFLRTEALSGTHSKDVHTGYEIPIHESFTGSSVLTGQPVWVVDASKNPNVYKGNHLQVISFLSIPLISESKPIGAIVVADKIYGKFSKNDEQTTKMLADSAVIAVENARLYKKSQQRRLNAENRRRVAEGLRELLTVINSNQPPTVVLNRISQQACQLLRCDASAISILEENGKVKGITESSGFSKNNAYSKQYVIYKPASEMTYRNDTPIVITDYPDSEKVYGKTNNFFATRSGKKFLINEYQTAISVLLSTEETIYGELLLFYCENRNLKDEEIELAVQLGDRAALAIKNAYLHEQVEKLARLEERQRIAQSLHDSVAQMLFSLGLQVDNIFDKYQPSETLGKSLQTIRRLASRSNYELRNAIFALREVKQTNTKSGIVALIDDLVIEFRTQTGIAITFITPESAPTIEPPVVDVIYRIVREALSNVSKHSKASAVIVNLSCDEQTIQIMIQDDGVGLQQNIDAKIDDTHLHFGIALMRQLVSQVKGEFIITNGDELGALVKARIPTIGDNA
jgi:two-component system, NarL family, sensor histidine kinase DevS